MKKEIIELITTIKSGNYDTEATHCDYDNLLERFISSGLSKYKYPEIIELISLKKNFWYA